MDKRIKMDYSLSDADIRQYLGPVSIIKYDQVRRFKNISKMLSGSPLSFRVCVILYQTSTNYGHWVCLFENQYGLNYFDSYGRQIDEPLESPEVQMMPGQDYMHLTKLLSESNKPVHYNDYMFQKAEDGINTCGRHVINRIIHKNKSCDEYKSYMDKMSKDFPSYDHFVTYEIY